MCQMRRIGAVFIVSMAPGEMQLRRMEGFGHFQGKFLSSSMPINAASSLSKRRSLEFPKRRSPSFHPSVGLRLGKTC